MANALRSTIGRATLIAGSLDLLSAFVFGGMAGAGPLQILRGVAAGPFGDAMREGGPGAVLIGIGTHFSIMAVMVSVYVIAASRIEWLRRNWPIAGALYGLALYGVMYRIVLVLRYPERFPKNGLWDVSNALFSHIVCVGIPIAYIASRRLAAGMRR
jgi:hypothetical protein